MFAKKFLYLLIFIYSIRDNEGKTKSVAQERELFGNMSPDYFNNDMAELLDKRRDDAELYYLDPNMQMLDTDEDLLRSPMNATRNIRILLPDDEIDRIMLSAGILTTTKPTTKKPKITQVVRNRTVVIKKKLKLKLNETKVELKVQPKVQPKVEPKVEMKVENPELKELKEIASLTKTLNIITNRLIKISESFDKKGCNFTKFEAFKDNKNGTKRMTEYKQGLEKIKQVLKKFSRNQSCCNFTLKDKVKVGKVRKVRALEYINIDDIMKMMNVTSVRNNQTFIKAPNLTMFDGNYTNYLRSKNSVNTSGMESKFNFSKILAEISSTQRLAENMTTKSTTPSNTSTIATTTTRTLTTTFPTANTTIISTGITLPTEIQSLLANVSNISDIINKPIKTNPFVKSDYSDFLDQINKYITQAVNQIPTTTEIPTTRQRIFQTEKEMTITGRPVKKSIDEKIEEEVADNSTVKKETANETHSLVFLKELYNFNKTSGKVLHFTIDKVTNTTRQLVNISVSLDDPENQTSTTTLDLTTPTTTTKRVIYQNYVFSPRYVNIGNFFFNTPKKPKGSFPNFFKRRQERRKKVSHGKLPTTPPATTTQKDTLEGYIKSLKKITSLWEKLIRNFSFSLKKSSEEDDMVITTNRNISYPNITQVKKQNVQKPFSEKYFIKPSTLLLKEPSNKYLVINVSSGSIFPINESLVPTFLSTLRQSNRFRPRKRKHGRRRLSFINPPFTSDLSDEYQLSYKPKKSKIVSFSDSSDMLSKSADDVSGYSDIIDRQLSDDSENLNVIKDFEYQIDQVRSLKRGPPRFQKKKYQGLRNHTVDIRSSKMDSSHNSIDKTRGRKFVEKGFGKIRHKNASNVSDIDFLKKIGVNPVLAKMIGKLDLSDMYALLNIIQEEGDDNFEKRSSDGYSVDDVSLFSKTDTAKATEDSVRDSLNYLGAFSKYIENKTNSADPQFYAQKLLGILNQLDLGSALKSDNEAGGKISNDSYEHPVFKFTRYFDNSIKAFKKSNSGKRPRRKRHLNYSLDSIPSVIKRPSYIRSFFAKKGGKRLLQKRPSWVKKLIKPLPKIKNKNLQRPDISHKTFIQNVQNTTDVILNYMSSMLDLLQEMYKRNQYVSPTQATYDSIDLLTKDFMTVRNKTKPMPLKSKMPDADEDQKYLSTLLHFLAKDIQKFGTGLRQSKLNLNKTSHSFDALWAELKTIASDYFNSKMNKTDKNLTIPKEFYAGHTRIPKRLNIELERYAEIKQPDSDYLWHVNKIEEEEMDPSKQEDLERQKNRKIFYIYSPASSNGILKKGPCVSSEEQIFFHFIPSRTYVKNEAKILGDTILNNIRKNNRIAVICGRNIGAANELANIFASRFGKQKHSDVIWINAETNETTTNDLNELLNMLDLKHCYKENRTHHSVYLDLLFDYFSKRTGLFILSNIKPWNILLQNKYFVNGDLLNVILTSDKRNWAGDLFEVIELSKYGLKVSNNHNDSNDNWDFFRQHPEILGTVNNFA